MRYLTHHMLLESANRAPGSSALSFGGIHLTYEDTLQRASGLAANLQRLGVRRGDRVAICLRPGLELPIAILGATMSGAVFVPVHHGSFPEQIRHIVDDCGASAIIVDGVRLEALEESLSGVSSLRCIIAAQAKTEQFAGLPVADFDSCQFDQQEPLPHEGIGKDLAAIIYTSGSTGRPKGVMLSHANVIAGAEIVADYLSITENDRLLAALPFSFDAGLNQLTSAISQGASVVMLNFRFGQDIVRHLQDENITGLAGVPSLWSLLAQPSSGLSRQPLPTLRYITNTGGAMPQNVLRQLREQLPTTDVFLMYGLTEAFRSTYLPPAELDRRAGSMGKAIPNTEILVVSEEGLPCGPGEVGELVHHGPTVSLGYWNQPGLTRKVLRPHPLEQVGRAEKDLVCYSGDLVKRDEDGFLFFVGRRDNQIKSSGFRISPTEVEEVICQAAPIRQAAVVGVPDALLGQRLVAFAIPQEGAKPQTPAGILGGCAKMLPRHMVPRDLYLVEDLPTTSSGKVDYPALAKRAEELSEQTQSPANANRSDPKSANLTQQPEAANG